MSLGLRLRLMYRRYVRSLFRKHALTTNIVTSGFLMWMGDLVQQKIEGHSTGKPMDGHRSARMFTVGLLEGPPHHYYYSGIDKLLPGRDLHTVGTKVLADQIIAAPCFITIFFFGSGFFEGHTFKESYKDLSSNIWTVYAADWLVWPPTQFINFYLVPAPYRVLYVNAVSVLYNVFLSYIKHRGVKHKKVEELSLEEKSKTKEDGKTTKWRKVFIIPDEKTQKESTTDKLKERKTKSKGIRSGEFIIDEQEDLNILPEVQKYKEQFLKLRDKSNKEKEFWEEEPERTIHKDMKTDGNGGYENMEPIEQNKRKVDVYR